MPDVIAAEVRELESLLLTHNSFDIISLLAFTQLVHDPETYAEWEHEGRAALAEYAALLCLKHPFQDGKCEEPIDGTGVNDLLARITRIFDRTIWYYATEPADKAIPLLGLKTSFASRQ